MGGIYHQCGFRASGLDEQSEWARGSGGPRGPGIRPMRGGYGKDDEGKVTLYYLRER